MGFKRQMLSMMIAGKSPEEIAEIAAEVMPEMIAKVGPEGIIRIMAEIMPQISEKVGPEGMAHIMDSSFSGMKVEQRRFLLTRIWSMLDSSE